LKEQGKKNKGFMTARKLEFPVPPETAEELSKMRNRDLR